MINCDKEDVICDINENSTCLSCNGEDRYICAKVGNISKCVRSVEKVNPLLEFVTYENSKLIYNCKYPDFATHTHITKQCNVFVGCYPTGKLIKSNEFKEINLDNVTSFEQIKCYCGFYAVSIYSQLGYPECQSVLIGQLLDKPNEYTNNCFGFTYFNGECVCPTGHISNKDANILNSIGYKKSTAYDLSLLPHTCIKKPCIFDPFTFEKLNEKDAYYDTTKKMCICNEFNGLIGIYIDEAGNGNAVDSTIINACLKTSTELYETNLYTSFYIPPEGNPITWFKSWQPNTFLFPTFKNFDSNKATYFNKIGIPNLLIKEYPLDSTFKSSKDDERDITYNKPDSILQKFDSNNYISKIFKNGDLIRNVKSVEGKHYPTLISFDNKISVYKHSIAVDDEDLVNVPQKKN